MVSWKDDLKAETKVAWRVVMMAALLDRTKVYLRAVVKAAM